MYRLPHGTDVTIMRQTTGEPVELHSFADIGLDDGFVFAPFTAGVNTPVLLIRPDEVEQKPVADAVQNNETLRLTDACAASDQSWDSGERTAYHDVFSLFHSQLDGERFEKVVLSRCSVISVDESESPELLFNRACCLYPRMFIALVSTNRGGTWLMATPEVLLEGQGREWRTIALAGTMRLTDEQLSFDTPECPAAQDTIEWSSKNIREQRYVASYIREKLSSLTSEITETEPYTTRAGRLVHLRSDFRFRLRKGEGIGRLIQALHPTPAVCGIPQGDTYDFIRRNEGFDRKYYSGFAGRVNRNGDTNLFVTLRCMQITDNGYSLYAGGGLLRDSIEEAEWAETEAKMETMRKCIAIKKT